MIVNLQLFIIITLYLKYINSTIYRPYWRALQLQQLQDFLKTEENYETSLELLKDRYANPQVIVSSHADVLLKLESEQESCMTAWKHTFVVWCTKDDALRCFVIQMQYCNRYCSLKSHPSKERKLFCMSEVWSYSSTLPVEVQVPEMWKQSSQLSLRSFKIYEKSNQTQSWPTSIPSGQSNSSIY